MPHHYRTSSVGTANVATPGLLHPGFGRWRLRRCRCFSVNRLLFVGTWAGEIPDWVEPILALVCTIVFVGVILNYTLTTTFPQTW